MKDSWINPLRKYTEGMILSILNEKRIEGVPRFLYEQQVETSHPKSRPNNITMVNNSTHILHSAVAHHPYYLRVLSHIVTAPVGVAITEFCCLGELLVAFLDYIASPYFVFFSILIDADISSIAHLDAVEIARILHRDTSLMNLLLSRKTHFRSNHHRFMGKLTTEQSECLCQKIDKLTRRGLLANWGYAVPTTPPSPSPAINDPEPRLPGSSTTPNEPLLSVADEPLLEADGIPLVTDPFNQTPTSPIEPPTTEDAKCVNYVPVVGVGSSNLRTTLVPVSELDPSHNIVLSMGTSSPEDGPRHTIDSSPLYRTVSISLMILNCSNS